MQPLLRTLIPKRNFQVYKVKNVNYDYEKLAWRHYRRGPSLAMKERNLDKHLQWNPNDPERLLELEQHRISARHLAHIMGRDAKNFTYDDQVRAMRYLMPGYAQYAEANPKLEHPGEWMGPYKNPENVARQQNFRLADGRPQHYLYFNEDITILDALNKVEEIYQKLVDHNEKIETDFINGKIKEYPEEYIECVNRSDAQIKAKDNFCSPAEFLGYSSLNKDYVEKFTSTLQKINRLPTAYLATELIETFQKGKSGEPDLYDDFYSEIVDEIEVLGEIQKNRHVSTSLETWNGQNTVNVTMIADGSGKFDVNGIPLHKFFSGSPDFTLRALSPLTFLQRLKDFDAVISVVGTPSGHRSDKGKEERKWVYARASKMHLPYKGAEPRFGPQINHTAAPLNGGSRMAKAISQGIAIAIVPFVSPSEAAMLKAMGLQLDDVKRKERSWFAGAGVGRLRGRKGKKWRRR